MTVLELLKQQTAAADSLNDFKGFSVRTKRSTNFGYSDYAHLFSKSPPKEVIRSSPKLIHILCTSFLEEYVLEEDFTRRDNEFINYIYNPLSPGTLIRFQPVDTLNYMVDYDFQYGGSTLTKLSIFVRQEGVFYENIKDLL